MNFTLNTIGSWQRRLLAIAVLTLPLLFTQSAWCQGENGPANQPNAAGAMNLPDLEDWLGPDRLTNTMAIFLVLTLLSLVPAIIMMTTSFVRIVIVLSITRQALGTQQLPPSSVITTLALFMTFHVMYPVFDSMYYDAVVPYTQEQIDANEMVNRITVPMRDFMAAQIVNTGNIDDVYLFADYNNNDPENPIEFTDSRDIPFSVLLPAFMLSEIRTGFMIGFQLFLPFLIIDMTISSILVSMGMMMLPPVLISLPFKLLLFVLVDGWSLIAGMLLTSFQNPAYDFEPVAMITDEILRIGQTSGFC